MTHVKAFLSCILIAVIGSAAGSPAPEAPFSFRADAVKPAFKEILGPSFPNDTEYVSYSASRYHLALSIVDVAIRRQWTLASCKYEATSRGGHIYEFNAGSGKCNIGTLQFKLCRTRQLGTVSINILPQFLTDGTADDGTIVDNLKVGVLLWSTISNPGAAYGTFRVQSPTILDFPGYYNSASSISKQTIFTETGALVSVDSDILVDSVCYTNSSCGVPFVTPVPIHFPNIKNYNESCGKVVTITLGQPLYLLSHAGIGCRYFPDSGYGPGTCSVNYRGYSNTGVNITVALVNFVDGDNCDGFYLSVLTYNTQASTSKTAFCTTDVTTVHSPVSRGRFDFKGISKTGRLKYGFVIKLVDA